MKGKIFLIALCSVVLLTVGTTVAYYNTKSFGFDDDVEIIYRDDEKITIMDYNIYYDDIDRIYSKLKTVIPDKTQTLTQHNVAYI